MFSKSAALYDLIYTKKKNCEDEAGQVGAWIEKLRPSAKTALDVACGTEAGLAVQFDDKGIFGRGLYIAENRQRV